MSQLVAFNQNKGRGKFLRVARAFLANLGLVLCLERRCDQEGGFLNVGHNSAARVANL